MRQKAERLQARLEGVQQQLASRVAGVKGDNEKWLVRFTPCATKGSCVEYYHHNHYTQWGLTKND